MVRAVSRKEIKWPRTRGRALKMSHAGVKQSVRATYGFSAACAGSGGLGVWEHPLTDFEPGPSDTFLNVSSLCLFKEECNLAMSV